MFAKEVVAESEIGQKHVDTENARFRFRIRKPSATRLAIPQLERNIAYFHIGIVSAMSDLI